MPASWPSELQGLHISTTSEDLVQPILPGGHQSSTIDDLRKLSIKRVPKAVYDYVDGGANEEISLARSRDAFSRIEFRPRVLRDVKEVDLGTTILGKRVDLPIIFAPTGYTRMMHYTGEPGVASVAAAHNMIYSLSTMGTTSAEELAAAVPEVRRWFQLYIWREPCITFTESPNPNRW